MLTAATFDLETTSLNADFGIVLCGVILPHDSRARPIVFRGDKLNPRWSTRRSDDSETVHQIASKLAEFDVLIAHNGAKFDLPFLRTRLAKHGLDPFPRKKLIDPVLIARNQLRMSYNSLEKIAAILGVNTKTDVAGELWIKAALDGDKAAMNYVVEHCVQDVVMLHNIFDKLKGYVNGINAWGSGY